MRLSCLITETVNGGGEAAEEEQNFLTGPPFSHAKHRKAREDHEGINVEQRVIRRRSMVLAVISVMMMMLLLLMMARD